ncbi:MAG: Hrp-dependent type effector protein [Paenibacillaceae bacterium]|nr:Hrp-dependent type effector protein [Paenibacillaceae bacterium]
MEQLKVGIIADDWTGACDSGVQLVKAGLRVYAVSEPGSAIRADAEALVFDTDSRALPRDLAYARVRQAAEALEASEVRLIYKKMDSTLRGNIGAELDAVYDAFAPDLVVIAPAFPAMGRCLINGLMYVHGQPLHETAVATDPRTPVTESDVLRLLARQSSRAIGHVTMAQLSDGSSAVLARLAQMREQEIRYVVFDAEADEHLRQVVKLIQMSGLKVVWAGSAGLASCLPIASGEQAAIVMPQISPGKPALVAVGSVNDRSRQQLRVLLQEQGVEGVGLAPELALVAAARGKEIVRVVVWY